MLHLVKLGKVKVALLYLPQKPKP